MGLLKRKKRVVIDDTDQAEVIREEAHKTLREVEARGPAIARLTKALKRRREQNHFGEDIEITFHPKPRGT